MVTLTKQELQSVIDSARNRMMEKMASRQDMQALQETIRVLTVTLQQSQQLLRQNESQRTQLVRRAVAMESRMVQMDQQLQAMRRLMTQLAQTQPDERITERVIMAQSEQIQTPEQRYYNPNPRMAT